MSDPSCESERLESPYREDGRSELLAATVENIPISSEEVVQRLHVANLTATSPAGFTTYIGESGLQQTNSLAAPQVRPGALRAQAYVRLLVLQRVHLPDDPAVLPQEVLPGLLQGPSEAISMAVRALLLSTKSHSHLRMRIQSTGRFAYPLCAAGPLFCFCSKAMV